MKAVITGISGQDGSYLAELLLDKGYEVHGIVRRQSVAENQDGRLKGLGGRINTYYGDLSDPLSLQKIIGDVKPDELYNLAAMSHVRISFDVPHFTIRNNALAVLDLLEIVRRSSPETKFYQASSSEMFGNSTDSDNYQRETTPMVPVSPYGCAKVMAFNLVRHYRAAYGLFTCNGILFNHESPRRGANFVTQKIVKTAVEISLGLRDELVLGNIDSERDWGHSKDYVRAMWMMLQHSKPDDYIVATGETRSIRDLIQYVFDQLGMEWEKFVRFDAKYTRPEELSRLRGDATKVREALSWAPSYTYTEMIDEMINHWQEKLCQTPDPNMVQF